MTLKMRASCKVGCALIWAVGLMGMLGCNASKDQTNIELVQAMMDQISLKAQDWDPKRSGVPAQLVPPEGTVPIGWKPYPYKGRPDLAAAGLKNPVYQNFSPDIVALGKAKYEVFCIRCHGKDGAGAEKSQTSALVGIKMARKPPSLLSTKIRKMKDGGVYHVIVDGFGIMGSHAGQIRKPRDRWSLVNYVRLLQRNSKSVVE